MLTETHEEWSKRLAGEMTRVYVELFSAGQPINGAPWGDFPFISREAYRSATGLEPGVDYWASASELHLDMLKQLDADRAREKTPGK